MIALALLGLAEAVIRPGPVFHYQRRADVGVGGGSVDFQAAFKAANVLAEKVKVIGLPLIFTSLSRSNICCARVPVAPS